MDGVPAVGSVFALLQDVDAGSQGGGQEPCLASVVRFEEAVWRADLEACGGRAFAEKWSQGRAFWKCAYDLTACALVSSCEEAVLGYPIARVLEFDHDWRGG